MMFNDFPAISKTTWLEKVEKDLKGKALSELEWQLEENIRLAPFYTASDVDPRAALQVGNDWQIGEDIIVKEEKSANQQLLQALAQGVNAPRLILEKKCDWASLFAGVHPEMIELHIWDKASNQAAFQTYFQGQSLVGSYQQADTSVAVTLSQIFPTLKTFVVKEETTNSEVSEILAQTLHSARQQLEAALDAGMNGTDFNKVLQFQLSIGRQYFVAIASIRALKNLWANVLKAYQIEPTSLPPIDVYIAATAYDDATHTNMIRASSIGLSAVVGGANRLTILPANAVAEEASEFTARIARNVQHLLKMESYLDRVGDPAAGSYYIEQLTDSLAEAAWKKFQKK